MNSEFENQLRTYLEKHLKEADGETPSNLAESIRYSLLAPGKRIRARMLLTCGQMLGLESKAILPAAAALEMIHCFTLIHDDLPCMDDDDFRRGMPSNHKKFGESLALLAGDALVPLAIDTFMDSQVSSEALSRALRRLLWASGPRGVIGGQAEESLLDQNSSLEKLKQMHRKKTGALFLAAILIPKDFSGIADHSEQGEALYAFADELGLAFQIADDLEDLKESDNPNELKADPRSILSHMSSKQAQTQTLENLKRVSQQLRHSFGKRADSLIGFADEIATKLTHALNHSSL